MSAPLRYLWAVALYAGMIVIGCAVVYGAPPAGTDPDSDTAKWFKSLERPDFGPGYSCCDESDCRRTVSRVVTGDNGDRRIEARTPPSETHPEGQWVEVPEEKILRPKQPNPTGSDVLCYTPDRGVMCFVFGVQA